MASRKAQIMTHPALAYMMHEAKGFLVRFETDLTNHDATALAAHPVHEPFSWILTDSSTHMAWPMGGYSRRYAGMVAEAYSSNECRFYFWDGYKLISQPSASALDGCMAEYEESRKRGHAPGFAGEF